jgi:hypothetical protein
MTAPSNRMESKVVPARNIDSPNPMPINVLKSLEKKPGASLSFFEEGVLSIKFGLQTEHHNMSKN